MVESILARIPFCSILRTCQQAGAASQAAPGSLPHLLACPALSPLVPLPGAGSLQFQGMSSARAPRRAAQARPPRNHRALGKAPCQEPALTAAKYPFAVQAAKPGAGKSAARKTAEQAPSRHYPALAAAAAAEDPALHEGSRLPALKTAPVMQSQVGIRRDGCRPALLGCWLSRRVLCPPDSSTCRAARCCIPHHPPLPALPQEILGALLAEVHSAGPEDMLISSARTANGALSDLWAAGHGDRSAAGRAGHRLPGILAPTRPALCSLCHPTPCRQRARPPQHPP